MSQMYPSQAVGVWVLVVVLVGLIFLAQTFGWISHRVPPPHAAAAIQLMDPAAEVHAGGEPTATEPFTGQPYVVESDSEGKRVVRVPDPALLRYSSNMSIPDILVLKEEPISPGDPCY